MQSFSLFLPTIITGLGYTNTTTAQLFTVPPNLAAFVAVLITSLLSDRIRARGPIMAAGNVLAIAGYVMLLVAKRPQVRYGGTFLVAVGVYPCSAMIMVSGYLTGCWRRPYPGPDNTSLPANNADIASSSYRGGCRTTSRLITSERPG